MGREVEGVIVDESEAIFFRVERCPARQRAPGSYYYASAVIRRVDSDEVVSRFFSDRVDSPEEARRQIDAEAERRLRSLTKPDDWGKSSKGTRLIERYLAMREKSYSNHVEEMTAPPAEAARIHERGKIEESEERAALVSAVNALDERERVELVAPNDYHRSNPVDAWILDELSAKKKLFQMIEAPSSRVYEAFRALDALLNQSEVTP
jgi:hypothetical protein